MPNPKYLFRAQKFEVKLVEKNEVRDYLRQSKVKVRFGKSVNHGYKMVSVAVKSVIVIVQ